MSPLEQYLEAVTAPGPDCKIPGCVLIAANRDGIVYSKCFGTQSVDPDSPLVNVPLSLDTTMWIASCTKLMTAIAVLQCVEKGLLALDEDISNVLSEWKDPAIIVGFEANTGKPILEKAKGKLTLRKLLSHQSGMGYDFIDEKLQKFAQHKKKKGGENSGTIGDVHFLPLLFEPGTSWAYGVGVDWAGQMVERVNNQRLGSYMEEHIWGPLGMKSTTFRLQERNDIKTRRADMSKRAPDGKVVPSPTRLFRDDAPDDQGGGGAFSCASDYIKILISLLRNDGTLLKPSSVDVLFSPCLSPSVAKALQTARRQGNEDGTVIQQELNYAVGGLLTQDNVRGRRNAGSLSWGGLPNLSWMVDRKAGIALLYCSQLLPSGDQITKKTFERFEEAVYSGELGTVTL